MRYLIATAVLVAVVWWAGRRLVRRVMRRPGRHCAGRPDLPCARLGPKYMLDMTFPVDYPDQQALTDYITQNRDGFVNVAQGSPLRDQPYQMDATSEQHSSGQPPQAPAA